MKIEYAFVRDIKAKSIKIAGTGITCQKQVEKRLIHKAVKMYQLEIVFSDFDFSYQEKTESSLILSITYRGVEKWLTHQIHALEIAGSNPAPAREAKSKTSTRCCLGNANI